MTPKKNNEILDALEKEHQRNDKLQKEIKELNEEVEQYSKIIKSYNQSGAK